MDVNPNLNQSIYGRELRDELGLVRNEIAQEAFKARDDKDLHRAIRLQGQHTLNLLKAVTSLWTDTYVLLLRETKNEPTLPETEAAYSIALANLFEGHLETTWASFGERAGERDIRSRMPKGDADIEVAAAARHHSAVSGFCAVYVAKLKDRAEELQSEAAAGFKI
jgi:hypothetical protein